MEGELVWNVHDIAELSDVGDIASEHVRGHSDVEVAYREEGKVFGVDGGGSELGQHLLCFGPDEAERSVQRSDVFEENTVVGGQVVLHPREGSHLLDGRAHEHVTVVSQACEGAVVLVAAVLILKYNEANPIYRGIYRLLFNLSLNSIYISNI